MYNKNQNMKNLITVLLLIFTLSLSAQQKPSKECVKGVVERYDHARVSVTTTNTCTNVIKVQTYLLVEWNKIQAEKKRKLRKRRAKRVKKV